MSMKALLLGLAGVLVAVGLGLGNALHAQAAAWALTGRVSSAAEGPMEGVLVSAKRDGSTITVTVVSDAQGRYRFPASALAPGSYGLKIRAVGYDLAGPGVATVAAQQTHTTDLRLVRTKNLAAQLSDAEWLLSMPGSYDQKRDLNDCDDCHSLSRVVHSTFTADQFQHDILPKMQGYFTNNTSPEHPQHRPGPVSTPSPTQLALYRPLAEYLARINLSGGRTTWTYTLKTMPRPKGASTHVIVTEYDLPRKDIEPHDVIVTRQGEVYYSSFLEQFIGQLDPKTGAAAEYPTPVLKPGFPTGSLDLEYDPRSGDLWLAMMHQGGILKFDPRTKAMQTWSIPADYQNNSTQQAFLTVPSPVDGKVWIKDSARRTFYRLDPTTGVFESFGPIVTPDGHTISAYGLNADSQDNAYGLDFAGRVGQNYIAEVDAKTGAFTTYATPTHDSRPRRGRFDAQDRYWFSEYDGNSIGMFDARTKEMREWPMSDPFMFPYDSVADRTGAVWTGSKFDDRVVRLDPSTGKMVWYLLPRSTNIRRVFVDNSTNPVTFWVGSNHGGSIVRLQAN
jgi:virginiamycin B lyase